MTEERIRKAAMEYADRLSTDADDSFGSGYYVGLYHGFQGGANWRTQSAWHDSSVVPTNDGQKLILVECNVDSSPTYYTILLHKVEPSSWEEYVHNSRVVRYAYIEDLI